MPKLTDCRILALLRHKEFGITASTKVEHHSEYQQNDYLMTPDPKEWADLINRRLDEIPDVSAMAHFLRFEFKRVSWKGWRNFFLIRYCYVPHFDTVMVTFSEVVDRHDIPVYGVNS